MHSIRQLEIIRMLAQHRHFGRAAAALAISQPALTRSLKQIEKALGVQLFDRDNVTPTLFGQIVLDHSDPVLGGFGELMRELSLAKGLELGNLIVKAGLYPADISVQTAVGRLSKRYPNLSIELSISNWTVAVDAVLDGQADLAVADLTEASSNGNLMTEPLRSCPLRLFVSADHPLARHTRLTLDDALEFPWVGTSGPGSIRVNFPNIDKPFGILDTKHGRVLPQIMVETFAAAQSIVLSGWAIGMASEFQLRDKIERGLRDAPDRAAMASAELRLHFKARQDAISSRAGIHGHGARS